MYTYIYMYIYVYVYIYIYVCASIYNYIDSVYFWSRESATLKKRDALSLDQKSTEIKIGIDKCTYICIMIYIYIYKVDLAVVLCAPCLWWWGRLCRRRCAAGGCDRAVLVSGGVSRGYTYHHQIDQI